MSDIVTLIDAQREQFGKVAVVKSVEFDRERGFALQILDGSEYLRKVAMQNPQSLANAITNVAALGVSLNPASKLAYLVPRKGAICLDISYMGLMYVAQDCGAIQWGQAVVVRAGDTFELQGLDKQPLHKYQPFSQERGEIIGVYVVVKTDGNDYLTHPMALSKVHDIRDRSDAWKAYQKDKSKTCPWVTDPEEMIKKTCVKQAAKYWPRRERLDTAVHHMNTEGDEGITLKPNTMPADEFEDWKKKIQDAETKEAAKSQWRAAIAICKDLGDTDSAEKLKAILLAHASVLDEAKAA
jgi:recombination protein RecT